MALREELEKTGNWLFRWRSYLPLFLAVIILAGLLHDNLITNKLIDSRVWKVICMSISFWGLCVRIIIIGHAPHGTSGGNTRKKVANMLNTTGAYSVVRHPLYLGNFVIWLGVSAFLGLWWITLVFILVFWLYYERIMYAEEEFLREKFGNEFEEWAVRTPAFLPRFKSWKKPPLSFSMKKVLSREYSPFFAIVSIFTALEVVCEYVVKRNIEFDLMWFVLFITGFVIYTTLRTIKKKTHLFDETNPLYLGADNIKEEATSRIG